jgi:hypothetical protein
MKEDRNDGLGGGVGHRDLMANLLQIAVINKMLPKGFKFELYDTVKRQNENSNNQRTVPQKRKKVRTYYHNVVYESMHFRQ